MLHVHVREPLAGLRSHVQGCACRCDSDVKVASGVPCSAHAGGLRAINNNQWQMAAWLQSTSSPLQWPVGDSKTPFIAGTYRIVCSASKHARALSPCQVQGTFDLTAPAAGCPGTLWHDFCNCTGDKRCTHLCADPPNDSAVVLRSCPLAPCSKPLSS